LEPENSALKFRRPWPTRKVFWNLAAAMMGFGLLIGVVSVLIAGAFGLPKAIEFKAFADGGSSGSMVGPLNYLLASRVVGPRFRVLSDRLSEARREIANSVGADTWEPLADRYALPVDSDDEFGQTAESFNYLMSSLDSSEMAERAFRHSLVERPSSPRSGRSPLASLTRRRTR
jgi:hypothetical protein